MSISEDHYLCDLCAVLRPKEPRAWGKIWIDSYWACVICMELYRHNLVVRGTGATHAARS